MFPQFSHHLLIASWANQIYFKSNYGQCFQTINFKGNFDSYPVIWMLIEFGTEVQGFPFSNSSNGIWNHFFPSFISAMESSSLKAYWKISLKNIRIWRFEFYIYLIFLWMNCQVKHVSHNGQGMGILFRVNICPVFSQIIDATIHGIPQVSIQAD